MPRARNQTPGEQHDNDLIAQLVRQPGFEILERRWQEARDRYYQNLARTLSRSPMPVDQRVIDNKRGFWDGGQYFLDTIRSEAKRFQQPDEGA